MIFSVAFADRRKAALGSCGISAIACTVAWMYGIESLKAHILTDAKSGGPFAQLATGFVNSIVAAGAGPYLVCTGGIIALGYYIMKEQPLKHAHYDVTDDKVTSDDESSEEISLESDEPASPPPSRKPRHVARKTAYKTANINRIVYKSSGTAALLAFIGAIFGLPGIGHIYVGRIGRGLLILVSGFILYIFSWISVLGGLFGGLVGSVASGTPNGGLPIFQTGVGLGVFLWFAYIALLIWQIFNARSLAKKLNEQIQLTGREPW